MPKIGKGKVYEIQGISDDTMPKILNPYNVEIKLVFAGIGCNVMKKIVKCNQYNTHPFYEV